MGLQTTQAVVTYDGALGVYNQIFSPVCMDCHTSSLPDNHVDRQGAYNGVNFDTYTLATSLPSYITSDPVTYPPATYTAALYANNIRALERAATLPQPNSASMPPTYLYVDYPGTTTLYTLLTAQQQTLLSGWQAGNYVQNAVPGVTTNSASSVTNLTATVNASIDPNGLTTTPSFRYSTTSGSCGSLGNTIAGTALSSSGGNSIAQSTSANLTGLSCGTTYYFCGRGVNSTGTSSGSVLSFTTSACSNPVITNGTSTTNAISTNESPDAFSLTLNATDADGGTLTWSISTPALQGTATASGTGASIPVSYDPAPDYSGTDSFVVTVTDNTSRTDTFTVNVNIGIAPPVISQGASVTVNMSEDSAPTAFSLTLDATDTDTTLSTLDWSITTAASHGSAIATGTGASRAVTYIPDSHYYGTDSFVVTVSDPQNNTDSITVYVNIAAVNNDAPVITSTAGTTAIETRQYQYQVTATDPDNPAESFTYSLSNAPAGMSISGSGLVSWTPAIGIAGSGAVTLTVTDSTARTDSETFTIAVTPPDTDNDSVVDYNDNCPLHANTDQSDIDNDELGDVCDNDMAGDGQLDSFIVFSVTQNSREGGIIFQNDGEVTVTASLDTDLSDTESYNWTRSDDNLLANMTVISGNIFRFDPASLAPGAYRMDVTVTDDGSHTSNSLMLKLLPGTPPVLTAVDTDGDGIQDNDPAEGHADTDNDGIPNYLDDTGNTNLLPTQSSHFDSLRYLQTDTGLTLSLGNTAVAAGHYGALVSSDEITQYGNRHGRATTMNADTGYTAISEYFDFVVSGVSPGDAVRVVLPLGNNIQYGAVYRKFMADTGWQHFILDNNNAIASATSVAGLCPAPGSSDYITGLNVFHNCVQLTLQDGGPNDADSIRNGVVRDPGVIAISAGSSSSTTDTPCAATLFNNCPERGGSIGALYWPYILWIYGLLAIHRLRRNKP